MVKIRLNRGFADGRDERSEIFNYLEEQVSAKCIFHGACMSFGKVDERRISIRMDDYLNRVQDTRVMRTRTYSQTFWLRASILLGGAAAVLLLPMAQAGGGGGLAGRHWYVDHIPNMPSWALPASFVILAGVYALIITEVIDRALAALRGAAVAVGALHFVGEGPELLDLIIWIDWETVGLLLGMMVIVGIIRDGCVPVRC